MHSILIQSLAAAPARETSKQPKLTTEGETGDVSFGTVFGEMAKVAAAPTQEPTELTQIKGDPESPATNDTDAVLGATEETLDVATKEAMTAPLEQIKKPRERTVEIQAAKPDAAQDMAQQLAKISRRPAETTIEPIPTKTVAVGMASNLGEKVGTIAKREARPAPVPTNTAQNLVPVAGSAAQAGAEQKTNQSEFGLTHSAETTMRQADNHFAAQRPGKSQQAGLLPLESVQTKRASIETSTPRLDQNGAQVQQNVIVTKSTVAQPAIFPEEAAHVVLSSAIQQERRNKFDALLPEQQPSKSQTASKPNTNNLGQIALAQPISTIPAAETSKPNLSLELDPLSALRSETSSTQSAQSLPTRTELPQHVARQIAEALQTMPNRPVEIRLSPEELGRVRLGVSTSEGNIMVTVLAERPETGDLMRRHISSLETAFQELGYSDISFAFGGGQSMQTDQESDGDQGSKGTHDKSDETVKQPVEVHLNAAPVTGLDIRL